MTAQNLPKRGSTAKRKRGARQKAMQALYQWDFDQASNSPEQVIQQFCDMQNMEKVDVEYFELLFNGAVENIEQIDAEISQHLDRELAQLDPIERAILRICCTELKQQLGTPYKVVVNEALEICKDFGADKGYRYINGIADKLAASLRSIEYNADHPSGNPLSEKTTVREPAFKEPDSSVKISIKEKPQPTSQASAPGSTASRSSAPRSSAPRPSKARPPATGSSAPGSVKSKSEVKPATAKSSNPDRDDSDQSDK